MNNPNTSRDNIEVKNEPLKTENKGLLGTKTGKEETEGNSNKKLELSPDIKQTIIQEAFRMFDTDNSGEIDKKEFRKLVKSLGLELNNRKINELMKKIDKNNSGQIDMEEFTTMMLTYQFNENTSIELHLDNAFNLYDKNQDGFISAEDLMKVSAELEDVLGKEEAMLIVQLGKVLWKNTNSDIESKQDMINKQEFYNMLEQLGFLQEKREENNQPEKENSHTNNDSPKNSSYNKKQDDNNSD